MKILKFIKAITFITLTTLTFQVNADNILNEKNTSECQLSIEKLNPNIVDENINDSSLNKDLIKNALGNCSKDLFVINLSNKILYLIFGDSVIESIQIINGILFQEKLTSDEIKKITGLHITNDSSFIIKTIAKLTSYFAIFFLSIIYVKVLLNLRKGEIDNTFLKNNLKIFAGLGLLYPMSYLNDFSLLQFIGLTLIVFAVVIANLAWSVSIFIIDFYTLKENLILKNSEIDDINFESNPYVIKSIEENVMAHVCEIKRVQSALDLTMGNRKNPEILEQNELYICLKNMDASDISELKGKYPNSPTRFLKTRKCFENNVEYKKQLESFLGNSDFCGSFNEETSSFDKELGLNVSNIRNNVFLSESYQNQVRNIALKVYKAYCQVNNKENILSEIKKFECIEQDNNYNFISDIENNSFVTMTSDKSTKNIINSLGIENDIKDLQNNIKKASIGLIDNNNSNKKEFSSKILNSISNGWLGTTSIYFSSPKLEVSYLKIQKTLKDSLSFSVEYASKFDEGFFKSLVDIKKNEVNQEIANIIKATTDKRKTEENNENNNADYFSKFSLLNMLKINNLNSSHDYFDCLNKDKNNNCMYTNLNPFRNMVSEGRTLLTASGHALTLTYIIKTGTMLFIHTEETKKGKVVDTGFMRIIDSLVIVFGTLTMLGTFFSIILPLIPYFLFAAMIVGWIVSSFKAIISIQFLAIYYLVPTDDEDIEGEESNIYKILINSILTPLFLIIGASISFILIHISIGLVNVSFSLVADFLNLLDDHANATFSLQKILDNLMAYIVYIVFICIFTIKSTHAMYRVPQALRIWLDLNIETNETMFSEAKRYMERVVLMKL